MCPWACVFVMCKFWPKVCGFLQFSREFGIPKRIRITETHLTMAGDWAESSLYVVSFYPHRDPRRLGSIIIPILQLERLSFQNCIV